RLRVAAPDEGAAQSGPVRLRPFSISLPGLKRSRHPGSGPRHPVDRKLGAEREADRPRRGFQFPGLRLKSTRHLAEWRSTARNCKSFFQVVRWRCRSRLWKVLPSETIG